MSTEMPAAVAAVFASTPTAELVLTEMGHAYGKAKFSGTCKLTGIAICAMQTTIRKLAFWTRNGRFFEGYVPAQTAELLSFRGSDPAHSTWRRWSAGWLDGVDLATMENGAQIEVMPDAKGAYGLETKGWRLEVAPNGTRSWRNGANRSTDAQLLAALRRTKTAAFYRFVAPFRFSTAAA